MKRSYKDLSVDKGTTINAVVKKKNYAGIIRIPLKWMGREVSIVNLNNHETVIKRVKAEGTGSGVYVKKNWIDHEVSITLIDE